MPFTSNGSGTVAMDDSVVNLYSEAIVFAASPELVADQIANVKEEVNGKSMTFTKYSNLALATTALTELDDVTSVAMSDSAVTITPLEYGAVVTTTRLANLQSAGKVDTGAAYLVGRNMGATLDKLAINVLQAGGGTSVLADDVAEASQTTTAILDKTLANRLYNKLARTNIVPFDGFYIGLAHDDVLHDLREDTSAGGWTDVNKYTGQLNVFKNEVGMYAGIRWLRSANGYINTDGGSAAIDTYHTFVCGFNALGKVQSSQPIVKILPASDKLGRFMNIGWHWVGAYGVIDASAYAIGISTSTVGSN